METHKLEELSIDGKEKLASPGGGVKTDGDKLMMQLIEPDFLEQMAFILTPLLIF